ncbi:hypothetical protein A2U01_0053807 [Trifolium medium]|uniref:Uncharacterized protein n=1 Tax=Trifolium medium TaxID=97028 RepID=A0A392R7L6_9FABA|nr:hypothetical protein [Trifolium medium]
MILNLCSTRRLLIIGNLFHRRLLLLSTPTQEAWDAHLVDEKNVFDARQVIHTSQWKEEIQARDSRRQAERAAAEEMERELFSEREFFTMDGCDLNATTSFTDFMRTEPPADP